MTKQDAYQQILEVAQALIQTQGYNAFSYRDIAQSVGIKTSSIHYHFPTKADLGKTVVKHHSDNLCAYLDEIMANSKITYKEKLNLFFDGVFAKTYLSQHKMCLGGMLASDALTLPETIQYEVKVFFHRIEEWLKQLLKQGAQKKQLHVPKDVNTEAAIILATLEGSLLLARLYQDEERLAVAKKATLARLTKKA